MNPLVKIIGVGDAGGTVINRLIDEGASRSFQLIAANTSHQALREGSKARIRVELGRDLLHGQGAGGNPELGAKAAEACADELYEVLRLADILYIVAGMGGGTGSGASPVIARIAQELRIYTIAIVGFPFRIEGARRQQTAESGVRLLGEYTDELIQLNSGHLLSFAELNPTLEDIFALASKALTWEIILHYAKRSP